ncbi:ECF transporter S component [Fructobacillus tropaeoli]|uniref:Substrate-specific component PanP of predicted pantothenate ECF transporter n=1 Tax=Fructobacillus tropaeoli TaxID=709323 RepID=A0A3F3HBW0_9LACO|nr:ECF transporter S component [Fructobacillus tropaeoli]GAP03679.1 substrate-specific component PanP of predicted pantothenate ECF transporter [Fructobacillus tropaeoli]
MSTMKTKRFVATTVFVAIVLLQSFVPFLGSLPLGAFVIGAFVTIVPMTAVLAGILLGPRSGLVVGLFWGLTSWVRNLMHPGTIGSLIFSNPVTALVPRLMVGLLAGYLAGLVLKKARLPWWGFFLLGAFGALLNTALVILSTTVAFKLFPVSGMGIPHAHLFTWLVGILGFNSGFEMIANGLLVLLIGRVLLAKLPNLRPE